MPATMAPAGVVASAEALVGLVNVGAVATVTCRWGWGDSGLVHLQHCLCNSSLIRQSNKDGGRPADTHGEGARGGVVGGVRGRAGDL
jgi:hypothetical protein